MTLPAVPCIGSTMIAPISPAVWERMTSRTHSGHGIEKLRARFRGEAAEGEPLDLALERLDVVGVAVTDAAHGDAGDEVDVLVAVLVDQGAVDAARHGQAGVQGKALSARSEVAPLLGDDLLRAGTNLTTLCQRLPPENRRAR